MKAAAARFGFIACGITSLDPLPHAAELDHWLRAGYGGNMRYLHRQAKKRKHPQLADLEARRAVVVLDNYYYSEPPPEPQLGPGAQVHLDRPRIARYARGEDYHRVMLDRLKGLGGELQHLGAQVARPYVDTGPIAERELAQRAGLGWIGRNTMLLRPGVGSWFFIGTLLTDLELEVDPPFTADHCGSCTRCLDACPTGAFVAERVLDATRCISYLTIEQKGPIPDDLEPRLAGWAFGCDICNEVCPWNHRFALESQIPEYRPRDAVEQLDRDGFATMSPEEFDSRFHDTPLARPGLGRMQRNWESAWRSLR